MHRFRYVAFVAALAATSAHAQHDRPMTAPPEWADYISAVRKAEAIEDIEQRCLAYPDLPRNEWREGAARARCALHRKPALSLDKIAHLLTQPDGAAELERSFAALLDAHYNDAGQREQIFIQFDVFDRSDRARKVADTWIEKAPESAYAWTASGLQYVDAAWKARGGAYAHKTASDNIKRMVELGGRAIPELDKALKINRKVSPACKGLMHVGQLASEGALQATALAHCIEVDPTSYRVVWAWQGIVAPQWGGSEDDGRQTVAFAASRVDKNPMLGALLGTPLSNAGRLLASNGEHKLSDEAYYAASTVAPDSQALGWTGGAARKDRDHWKAFAYLSQALRFQPDQDEFLLMRARSRIALGDFTGAVSDAQRAVVADPANGSHAYELGEAHKYLHHTIEARNSYRKAMDDPDVRMSAHRRWCESYLFSEADEPQAVACTKELVAAYPTDPDSWFMRTGVLQRARNPGYPAAANQFLQYGQMSNPRHREMADAIHAERVAEPAGSKP